MKITEYEKIVDNAIALNYLLIDEFEQRTKNLSDDETILSTVNYNKLVYDRYNVNDLLFQQRVSYLFEKMSREEFTDFIQMRELGTNPKILRVNFSHTVKDYDTLQKIASDYNVDVKDILLHNNITVEQFEDLKIINGTVKIPTTINPDNNQITDVLVVGSQAGTNVWGVDWGNEITWNDETDDIVILSQENTLRQGLKNSFGEKGDIPGHEDYTIEVQIGTDITGDIYDAMLMAQLETKILQDKRFKKVEDIVITPTSGGRMATITVTPINVTNPLKPIPTDIPSINK